MKIFTILTKNLLNSLFILFFYFLLSCNQINSSTKTEYDKYDGPEMAAKQEIEKTKDPATGTVPRERLINAIQKTIDSKDDYQNLIGGLSWIERGPNGDLSGPFGNPRPPATNTSGRIRAMMVDSLDATKKTVWVGGVDGGLWRTSDITASPATWVLINDNLSNLAISDITQDPRPGFQNIMYFCTGESYFNFDAVRGNGVFKSIDAGATWTYLASTSTYTYCTRILCDYLGNVYLGTRGSGLLRSTALSGGGVWVNITPSSFPNSDICDLEITSTSTAGRLHVVAGIFSTQAYRYVDNPEVATSASWNTPAIAFPSFSNRAEICVSGTTLYSLVVDGTNQVPTIYKSTNGGANWAATGGQPTAGWTNGQGWYDLSCAIDPTSAGATCIVGGLDNWKTINGGTSWAQISGWATSSPGLYVHADQHDIQWWDNGDKLMFGCDGGVHYSTNKGTSMTDKNLGLRIKQFYSVAIHPSTTNYFLAGAQDNGVHQFSNAGLSSTVEVTGGDGAFTAIDQDQPLFQFGSYVFNDYRRSTNGGATWSNVTLNSSTGQFINPFDYDNTANILYSGDIASNYRRWTDPQTGSTSAVVNITSIVGSVTAVSVSPYTANKVFFGTSSGRVVQVDGANTIASGSAGTDRSTGLPGGTVSCINFGTDDLNLMCVESNYGINNVWVSTNGGASWTAIDGNLPDMPVRWCMFYPGNNTKAYIATETGVWETDLINGASTIWNANPTFPTVRTDMIKYRASDRTIAAATHGRGLWTTTIPVVSTPDLSFQNSTASANEYTSYTSGCRGYTDYKYYMVIANSPVGAGTVTLGIAGGATATNGVDYAITTNGNFAAPSLTMNFASGSGTAQAFTVRVYDDIAVESPETFTLNYSVTGGNAQAGGSNQTLTFTINDNDVAPIASSSASNSVGIYNANSNAQAPFNCTQAKFRQQALFTVSELVSAGITTARNFNSMTLRVVTKNSIVPYSGFTISMANTSATNLNTGFINPTFTTVYPASSYSTVTGDNLFTFTTPFAWDGTSNIVINFCYDNAAGGATSDITEVTFPLSANYTTYSDGVASSPCTANAAFISNARIRATFGTSITGTPVSTALNSAKTGYLGPFDDVYYYDASGNIIARIRNLTAFDYGCTTIDIDRAGSSSAAFWNNNTSNYLFSKSCRVIPTNNTSTGSYQITLYYTPAEVAGWETATGRTWSASSMQMAKVSNGFFVPDVTPSTPRTANVSFVTGTKGTLGTNYSIQGDFSSTGFSGFGTGVLGFAVPINLNYFTGTRLSNGNLLNWKVNFTGSLWATMILERSFDGRSFSSIHSTTADALRCLQPFDFNDYRPLSGMNYYRLKIVEPDGKTSYSNIVALLNAVKGFEMVSITPNPVVGDYLTINITSAKASKIDLQISDMQGRQVMRFYAPLIAGYNTIPVKTNKLPAGTYNISGYINAEKNKTLQFIKR